MSESTPAAAKPAGKAEDFIDVYIAPAELFERRSDGKFGLALLVLIVIWAVLFFLTKSAMAPIFDAEFARGMASRPNLTPEQIATAKRVGGMFASFGVIIGIPIAVFLLGLLVFIAGRIAGARIRYVQGVTIATFCLFPRLIELITNAVQALLMDESKLTSRFAVSLGLGRLFDPQQTGAVLMAFLGRIDIFTLWVTVLIVIGIKQMGKVTTGQAAIAGLIVWLGGALPVVIPALMQKQ